MKAKLLFSQSRVARLTGLDRDTILSWVRRDWLHPIALRDTIRYGKGTERFYGGWQLLGLGVLGVAHAAVRQKGSYVGRAGIVGVLRVVESMSDDDFFNTGMPDDAVVQVATRLAHLALPDDIDVTGRLLEVLVGCTAAVDREVKAINERHDLSTAG